LNIPRKTTLRIDTPRWADPLLVEYARYRAAYGGRGSGKSWFFASLLVERHLLHQTFSVCIREIQKDLKHSAKRTIEVQIERLGLSRYFRSQQNIIKCPHGGHIIFQGMQNHNADSIKSLESYDIAWIEEARNISQNSLNLLRPTFRGEKSEIWACWNPRFATDPIDKFFRGGKLPKNTVVVNCNYYDNPWFPDVLREEMEYDKRRDPDKYAYVWKGEYEKHSESRVFKNWRIDEFEAPADAILRFGADWGFTDDPSILVRSFMKGRELYIEYEAYKIGCEILDLPELFDTVPESRKWPIIADSSRPETISHLRNNGFPKIQASIKGANSVEEGVDWLKSYEIIIHPRCIHGIDELILYSYKIDKATEQVLPILEDRDNHFIDSLRYSHEGLRRAERQKAQHQHADAGAPRPTNNPMTRR